jgi:acetyltransferase-like isoleucine patch superfamily enzyme
MEPEEANKRELMEFYGCKGKLGVLRLSVRLVKSWVLQSLASKSPIPALTVRLQRARGVKIGRHVFMGTGVEIDMLYPHLVTIEDYVSIGNRSMIFAHSNPTFSKDIKEHYYPRFVAPVHIKRGAWIAPANIVMAGITIGENSVVGCGSVVTKDVEPFAVVGGAPARLIKKLKPLRDAREE